MNKNKFEEYTKNLNLKQIHTGSVWTEGPCYLKKTNKVIWSDIPNNRMLCFDFKKVEGLSNESKERLLKIKPETLGQASRIFGIRPTDITLLGFYLKAKSFT